MKGPALPVWLALLVLCSSASALTNIYSTSFERSEGYDPAYELIGQNHWKTDSSSFGGNGLITNYLGTQAGYIGLWPLEPPDWYLALWQPLNFSPLKAGMPIVTFTVSMAIVDSTNGYPDDFYWSAYNSQGTNLFTLDFWNVDHHVYYALETNQFVDTGHSFTNDTPYSLTIIMDFARNQWTASLSGVSLFPNQPITTTGALLDLGDMDAIWYVGDINHPGDNFMIFDDYKVTADTVVLPTARLSSSGLTADGRCLLHVTGTEGARFSVDASTDLRQWTALKTNVITGGYFDYIDPTAPGFSTRFYRARLVP